MNLLNVKQQNDLIIEKVSIRLTSRIYYALMLSIIFNRYALSHLSKNGGEKINMEKANVEKDKTLVH